MLGGFINFKAKLLAFEIAFLVVFFLGIFWNPPYSNEKFTQDRWHYINRGHPVAWSGVSKPNLSVDFPLIKAPFLEREAFGDKYAKIIDLKVFILVFLGVFFFSYFFALIFVKAVEENKVLYLILIPSYVIFFFLCIFVYFFWFPRI